MTPTADRELCAELFRLMPEWIDTYFLHVQDLMGRWSTKHDSNLNTLMALEENKGREDIFPAYDLGFLMRKFREAGVIANLLDSQNRYVMDAGQFGTGQDDTPENAAIKLLITLIKDGRIKV